MFQRNSGHGAQLSVDVLAFRFRETLLRQVLRRGQRHSFQKDWHSVSPASILSVTCGRGSGGSGILLGRDKMPLRKPRVTALQEAENLLVSLDAGGESPTTASGRPRSQRRFSGNREQNRRLWGRAMRHAHRGVDSLVKIQTAFFNVSSG